ncbi:MAG: hypothetical protein K6G10_04705 [Butyrivibrio sp.]|nr:hypothetical protein [Butyrivibrio sp.]
MSEKITWISENIRTPDENKYKKGDLSYARNRTIGAGTETEDEYDAAEIARWKQMHGTKGRDETNREHDPEIVHIGKKEYGKSDSENTTVNKERVASGSKYMSYKGKEHLKFVAAEENTTLNGSNGGNDGGGGENVGNGSGMPNRNASLVNRLRQAYRQISSQNKAFNRTSEALINARRRITRASLNSIKKSGVAAAKDKETVAGEYNATDQIDVVSAHYFHLFNMIENAGTDGKYILPIGSER